MRRVVVTGIGLVTPLASGRSHLGAADRGRIGIRSIQSFDVSDLPCKIAGQVPVGDAAERRASTPTSTCRPRTSARSTRSSSLRWPRPSQAVEDSGWKPTADEERERTGVMIGSGIGGLQSIYEASLTLHEKGPAPAVARSSSRRR